MNMPNVITLKINDCELTFTNEKSIKEINSLQLAKATARDQETREELSKRIEFLESKNIYELTSGNVNAFLKEKENLVDLEHTYVIYCCNCNFSSKPAFMNSFGELDAMKNATIFKDFYEAHSFLRYHTTNNEKHEKYIVRSLADLNKTEKFGYNPNFKYSSAYNLTVKNGILSYIGE